MQDSGLFSGAEQAPDSGTVDTIEVRIPPKAEYQSVVRAVVGVLAGGMSFTYNEIIQLRVAVIEAYQLAIRLVDPEGERGSGLQLTVQFNLGGEHLEIIMPNPGSTMAALGVGEELESQAVMESLMDEVEINRVPAGETLIRMTKRRTVVLC